MPENAPEHRPVPQDFVDAAQRYARRRNALFVAHLFFGAAYLSLMMGRGSDTLVGMARAIPGTSVHAIETFCYFALFSLCYLLLRLPLAVYGDYLLEHQFGLSTMAPVPWAVRQVKKWLLSFTLAAPIAVVLYELIRALPRLWWLPAGSMWLFLGYVLARITPTVLMPLFYKFEPIDDPALTGRLEQLARRAGITLTGVCRMNLSRETKKANAMVMGMGSSRHVALGDTLLASCTREEIAVVFAHELGHVVGRDLLRSFVLFSAVSFASLFLASRILGRAAAGLGIDAVHDPRTLPAFIAILGAIQLLVMPFANAYSRWRERLCDAYALRATGDRDAFISMMTKLARRNLADLRPSRLAELLLYDHPPIGRRIRFARNFDLGDAK
jgi:STE24 endopeptidase